MRQCRHCRKFNSGWPLRCRHCGAGLEGRLCLSNHVNPTDTQLSFCGECGKPLQRICGAGFSPWPYLIAFLTIVISLPLSFLFLVLAQEVFVSFLIAIIIMIVGFRVAIGMLPPGGQQFFRELGGFLLRVLFGAGLKGRR